MAKRPFSPGAKSMSTSLLAPAKSKLKLPALKPGTARNLNTVRKLAEMAAAMEDDR